MPLLTQLGAPPRRHRFAYQLIGSLLLSLPLAGLATAQSLSFDAALRTAESRSQALLAQDAEARSAREMAVAAGRLPEPVLNLSIDNVPAQGPMRYSLTEDFMTMRSLGVMQTYTRPATRRARSARFEREADAAATGKAVQLATIRMRTAKAWFERYYQQQMLDLVLRQRDEAALQAAAVEAAYRGGRAEQADVFMARSTVTLIEDRLHELRAELENAGTTLARWVGHVPAQPLTGAPRIDQPPLDAPTLTQLEHHPEIALLTAKERVALAEAEVARQEKNADWSWSLMYSKRGRAFDDMLSFGVSVPLQWNQKNRQDRELAARLAKVDQVRAEREELRRDHHAELERLLASWRSKLTRLIAYDKSLIPLTAERTQATQAAYRGAKAPLAAVLEARRMELDTRIERLRIEMQTASLWAELAFLIPGAGEQKP